ncbi:sodium:solute symporter family protein, partial [Candidatus Cardinium hertigii]
MVNIDLVIVGVFLIITLAIGFYYGKGITTFQDYAVGNRKMTNLVITISLIATIYGGNMLSSRLNIYYDLGLYELIMDLVHPIAFYLASRFVIIRMKEFVGHLSIAESMGSMYGPTVRMLTGIFGIMMTITLLTCQIKIGLNITAILFPETALFSTPSAIFLATLVVFYATFGGARAVALTDVYQFLLFGLCFPMLSFVLLYYAKDPIAGWQKLMDMPQFNIGKMHIWNNGIISKVLAYFIFSFVFSFNPAPIQRFYMAPSVWKAAKVFSKSAIIRIILPMLFLSVAIALYVGGHVIKPNQSVLHYIIGLPYFPGMRGILVTTIIALLMSTADSNLHAASVLFANDVWPMMGSLTKRVGKPSLQVVRVASVVIGIISLFLVLHTRNNAQLFIKTASIYGPVVSIPFLMACFGFRPRSITVLCSMGINIILAIYRIYYTNQLISSQNIFKPLFFSALILLVIHYILPQCPHTGWVGIKEHSPVDLQNQATKQWWKERLQRLTLPFTKSYRKTLFPKKGSTFILFGIYVIISTIIALCFIQKDYFFPYVYGYMSSMAIGTILVIYPTFHSYKKEGNALLHWLWPGLVGMLLFVANLQFAKLGHFSPMVCALFVSNLTLGIVFLSLEISMAMLGIAIITHLCIPPSVPFWNCFWAGYNEISIELIFAMLLITAAMVGLGTYKHLRDKANAKLKVIELRGNYERRIALEAIYNQANWSRLDMTHGSKLLQEMGAMLQKPCHYLYTHGQEQLGENINLFMHKLQKFSSLLLQRAKEERSLELNQKAVKPIEIEPTILKVYGVIRGLGEPMQLLLRNHTEVTQLLTDPSLFECFLTLNIWEISKCPQAADHMVTLTVSDTTLRYDYAIVTQTGKKMLTLPALAFSISTDDSTQNILPAYDIMDKIPPVCL